MSRRRFLQRVVWTGGAVTCGAAGIGGIYAIHSRRRSRATGVGKKAAEAPSNRIALGFIGVGDHGTKVNLTNFLSQPDAQVVALCDVDQHRLVASHDMVNTAYGKSAVSGKYRGCFLTKDWREIVSRDDVDAVVISTPDHWHAIPAIAAAKSGKDVFCEKPMSLTIQEGRAINDVMSRYGRVCQIGTPNRSRRWFLQTCEVVRSGRIGKLHTIRVQIYRGYTDRELDLSPDASPQAPPAWFDYDMWLGQAPEAPYTPARCHFYFRYNLDYSGGNLLDFGAHILDVAQWGNDTEHTGPVSVEGRGRFATHELYNVPIDWDITFRYANGVNLICKSGGYQIRFEGDAGWVQTADFQIEASSPDLLRPLMPEETHLRTCPLGEQRDFLNCVKSRSEPYAPPKIEHRSITLAHLGMISMRLSRKLNWDPEAERFVSDDDANRMLSRSMRSPWHL